MQRVCACGKGGPIEVVLDPAESRRPFTRKWVLTQSVLGVTCIGLLVRSSLYVKAAA